MLECVSSVSKSKLNLSRGVRKIETSSWLFRLSTVSYLILVTLKFLNDFKCFLVRFLRESAYTSLGLIKIDSDNSFGLYFIFL